MDCRQPAGGHEICGGTPGRFGLVWLDDTGLVIKWYNPYRWPYKWVTGVTTHQSGVIIYNPYLPMVRAHFVPVSSGFLVHTTRL